MVLVFILERKERRERKKHRCEKATLISCFLHMPYWDLAHNRAHSDGESNRGPLRAGDNAGWTEPHWPGLSQLNFTAK